MAVPKRKTSKARRDKRRSHHALTKVNVVIDKSSGEYKLPHHICLKDGTYKGQKVLIANEEKSNQDS